MERGRGGKCEEIFFHISFINLFIYMSIFLKGRIIERQEIGKGSGRKMVRGKKGRKERGKGKNSHKRRGRRGEERQRGETELFGNGNMEKGEEGDSGEG